MYLDGKVTTTVFNLIERIEFGLISLIVEFRFQPQSLMMCSVAQMDLIYIKSSFMFP